MNKFVYQLDKSLGKYRASHVNSIGNVGFCGEICDEITDQYNNGKFKANIYTNGKLTDIEINGWIFSFHFEGSYHLPGTYKCTNFTIDAIDPNGLEVKLYNTPYYSLFSSDAVLCTYLDLIHLYSHFESADDAARFYKLLRSLEGHHRTYRSDDSDLSPEVGLEQALYFKTYYRTHINDCPDKKFMDIIKRSVNEAVDFFLNKVESYKIED